MPLPPDRVLSVLPNPHHALDAHGHPVGVPHEHGRGAYVGAKIDPKRTVTHPRAHGDTRPPLQDTAFIVDDATPVQVPNTKYYLERLADGSLLPADERTARAAGVKFVAPDKARAAAREAARERWKASMGEDLPAPVHHDEPAHAAVNEEAST